MNIEELSRSELLVEVARLRGLIYEGKKYLNKMYGDMASFKQWEHDVGLWVPIDLIIGEYYWMKKLDVDIYNIVYCGGNEKRKTILTFGFDAKVYDLSEYNGIDYEFTHIPKPTPSVEFIDEI